MAQDNFKLKDLYETIPMVKGTEEDLGKLMARSFGQDLFGLLETALYAEQAKAQDTAFLEDLHRINGTASDPVCKPFKSSDPRQPAMDDAYAYCHQIEERVKKLEVQNHRFETAVSKLVYGSMKLLSQHDTMHYDWGLSTIRAADLAREEPRSKIGDVPDYRPGPIINCDGDWEP